MSRDPAVVTPELRTNPSRDTEFRRNAHAALRASETPAGLEAMLRRRYPEAIVRVRDLSAETVEVWYVYRDGHWVAPNDGDGWARS